MGEVRCDKLRERGAQSGLSGFQLEAAGRCAASLMAAAHPCFQPTAPVCARIFLIIAVRKTNGIKNDRGKDASVWLFTAVVWLACSAGHHQGPVPEREVQSP